MSPRTIDAGIEIAFEDADFQAGVATYQVRYRPPLWMQHPPDPDQVARLVVARVSDPCHAGAVCRQCTGVGWEFDVRDIRRGPVLCDQCGGSGLELEFGGEA
jgi:hypothetical protein